MEIVMEKELELLSNYLSKQPSLYIKDFNVKKESLKEQLLSILEFVRYKSNETLVKGTDELVTGRAHRRTFKELFLLLRDDFNITPLDLYTVLHECLINKKIRSFICANIGKRVYFSCDNAGFDSEDIDEFGISYSKLFKEPLPSGLGYYGSNYTREKLNMYEKYY